MEDSGTISKEIRARLRQIPSTDRALESTPVRALVEIYPRAAVVESLRRATEALRHRLLAGETLSDEELTPGALARATNAILEAERLPTLRRAINATGVILHTGLGRAVLSERARAAVSEVAGGHSVLELDVETGKRGSRQAHIEPLLKRLTGCEAALAVNNNAAAVFLAINTLAAGREVIVSRGQLVEIGGSFRVPNILRRAGAKLVEVGATNKTRLRDYAAAITPETALLLHVHPSNFKMIGFAEETPVPELVDLGRERGVPVMVDLGSGALLDFACFGLAHEPTVQETLAAGPDLVTFSGDKLIGGPQAGLIVGKTAALDLIRTNPIARVVRIDKLSLAALEATLRQYVDEVASEEIPTLRAIARPLSEIRMQATELAERLRGLGWKTSVEDGFSEIGGGSLPGEMIATALVTVDPTDLSADALAARLRAHRPPILARIARNKLTLDPRTLLPGESEQIIRAMERR